MKRMMSAASFDRSRVRRRVENRWCEIKRREGVESGRVESEGEDLANNRGSENERLVSDVEKEKKIESSLVAQFYRRTRKKVRTELRPFDGNDDEVVRAALPILPPALCRPQCFVVCWWRGGQTQTQTQSQSQTGAQREGERLSRQTRWGLEWKVRAPLCRLVPARTCAREIGGDFRLHLPPIKSTDTFFLWVERCLHSP